MANAEKVAFKDSVLHQLHELGLVDVKAMFGAYGLYFNGVFFGIIDNMTVYFKTDDASREAYLEYGMPPFEFGSPDKPSKNYYEVPPAIFENPTALAEWARTAIEVAKKGKKKK